MIRHIDFHYAIFVFRRCCLLLIATHATGYAMLLRCHYYAMRFRHMSHAAICFMPLTRMIEDAAAAAIKAPCSPCHYFAATRAAAVRRFAITLRAADYAAAADDVAADFRHSRFSLFIRHAIFDADTRRLLFTPDAIRSSPLLVLLMFSMLRRAILLPCLRYVS